MSDWCAVVLTLKSYFSSGSGFGVKDHTTFMKLLEANNGAPYPLDAWRGVVSCHCFVMSVIVKKGIPPRVRRNHPHEQQEAQARKRWRQERCE